MKVILIPIFRAHLFLHRSQREENNEQSRAEQRGRPDKQQRASRADKKPNPQKGPNHPNLNLAQRCLTYLTSHTSRPLTANGHVFRASPVCRPRAVVRENGIRA